MIIFRVDGNREIGLGHLMRCMSIADELKKNGQEVLFILADENFKDIVRERGFNTVITYTLYSRMQDEIDLLHDLIKVFRPKLFIVDSYFVNVKYLSFLKTLCRIGYIDDLAAFPYPVDVLINYNVYAESINYFNLYKNSDWKVPKLMIGLKYVPLRDNFVGIPSFKVLRNVKHILISTGGTDPIHLMLKIIEFFREVNIKEKKYVFHMIIGPMNSDKERIIELAKHMYNMVVYQDVKDMRSLMMKCDIAISAAGSTLYELCACGIPTITYVLADNQINGAKAFENKGLMISLGDVRDKKDIIPCIMKQVLELEMNFKLRKKMSESMQQYVDGLGAKRLVDMILE